MTSRLDRLLLLLETGSSATVRHTAARQLAQLAAKSVAGDVANVALEEDLKNPANPPGHNTNNPPNFGTRLHVHGSSSQGHHDPASWRELMGIVAKILPFLHSKSHETRSAASTTLSHIFTLVPLWQPLPPTSNDVKMEPVDSQIPPYPSFSLPTLLSPSSKLLLASSGKEFILPARILGSSDEVKRARKEAMSRLGLDFLNSVGDELDIDKELAGDDVDIDMELAQPPPPSSSCTDTNLTVKVEDLSPVDSPSSGKPPSPAPSPTEAPLDASNMSARELNRLKRKRKLGNSAFVSAPPPPPPGSASKFSAAPAGNKARLVAAESATSKSRVDAESSSPPPNVDKAIVDPSKGGAIAPTAQSSFKALEVSEGSWVWDGLVKVFEVDLFSPAWQVRHGAAMALRELIKIQGAYGGMKDGVPPEVNELAHEKWCNDLSAQFLCVLTLDRFGDFVSDQVVAPVRETVSQTLAALLIHMPKRSVVHVHTILLDMIQQNFARTEPAPALPPPAKRGRGRPKAAQQHNDRNAAGLVWEVRHAGLLGVKYEVAVRNDLFEPSSDKREESDGGDIDMDIDQDGRNILRGVVDSAVLGLSDRDDDVRAVAAGCLLPVAGYVVQQLPESLENILLVLYGCLCDMKDDLNSSVGAVMDLLGRLVAYDKVIEILGQDSVSLPLTTLAPSLFPFFRHTIANVRFAVVKTLHSFMTVPSLPRSWISASLLQLLFQNLIVEERADIREASLEAWRMALSLSSAASQRRTNNGMDDDDSNDNFDCPTLGLLVSPELLLQWFTMLMTPIGTPIDATTFCQPVVDAADADDGRERHNVDKNMLNQDLALVGFDITLKARMASSLAVAHLLSSWPNDSLEAIFSNFLGHYVGSASMLQKLLVAIIAEEWAHQSETTDPPLVQRFPLAADLTSRMLAWLQSAPPPAYHEMAIGLSRIHYDCTSLLQSFSTDCKLPASAIPSLGTEIDITGQRGGQDVFTLETAQKATGAMFNQLKGMLGKTKKKELGVIADKRAQVIISIERYNELKGQYDTRVSAAFASSFVAFRPPVDKVGPIVKGIMNGVKFEENLDLQDRFACAVASFVDLFSEGRAAARDKIITNLCTFICSDVSRTPTWVYNNKQTSGILTLDRYSGGRNQNKETKEIEGVKIEETDKASLSRRGSVMALEKLSVRFGPQIFTRVPNMWNAMTGGLLTTIQPDSLEASDAAMEKHGQNVIDSLSVLEAVAPTLHQGVWNHLADLFPVLTMALRSRFAIIRQLSARCFSTICEVMPSEAMRYAIENIIPLLADPLSLSNREGATELMYHIVEKLDVKALPYVIFLVVPVLGRMSDSSDDVRATSTNTFASLVKMIPLEAGLPDPPDFPDELLKRRDTEREFLTQLLDGSKVQQYEIPVKINAELRPYQQDGVNWLAFLSKYQLHGILCDDMGLGKTLQSICILASKHYERTCKREETKSPDSVHLPSLIVCPPTLSGHWYYEILKYATNLKPFMYVGNAKDRARNIPKLKSFDVIITSYEVVRNDINNLEGINWLYCILDEGHVIKNAKTKLTKAVKQLRAQHRLILSGTPIQNNVLELWSLFDFLMPGFLGTEHSFNERFSKPILANRDGKSKNGEAAALALEALHKQVLPFLLRRLKEDVLNDLPPKIIQDYYCDLSEMQKNLYDDFAKSRALASAEGSLQPGGSTTNGSGKPNQHIFQALQYLRKLCNHPALVLKEDAAAIQAALNKVKAEGSGMADIQHAPKLLALKQLLHDCGIGVAAGVESSKNDLVDSDESSSSFSQHRVLIFCQMKQMLDIIEQDLFKRHMPSVTYMRLDGTTDQTKRHNIVQTFNADPTIDCLLLTTHVGGLGLTLTGADTVIFVEHDWNPMKDLQAMDRAHRIGQKKVVNVYRLITKGTLEEKIMGLQRFKLNIANSVVTQQNSGLSSMGTDQVLDLFRRSDAEEAAELKRKGKEESGPVSQKNVLEGLEDLPPEDEYENLDLSSFIGSLGRNK